jgi:Domain of unknown function (DUF4129)
VTRRRLLLLGLGVTALLVLAGIASHGRPLALSKGGGPTVAFYEYSFTTLLIAGAAIFLVVAYAVASQRPGPTRVRARRWYLLSALLTLILSATFALLILRSGFGQRLRQAIERSRHAQQQQSARGRPVPTHGGRNVHIRWGEVIVVVALVGGAGVFLLATRRTRRVPRPWRLRSQEAVSLALDESLDDLRNEPDLRRAIIAAYARMERALAQAGTPRLPAEAPMEYLQRALRDLDTSAGAMRRLTDLFEWAKFSQHEPEARMRDEAIDALVALRDELNRPDEAAVA